MDLIKQSVGIDISKSSFTACLCSRYTGDALQYSETKIFKNEKTGFNQLLRWVNKTVSKQVEVVFLMEATGVYYEPLAYQLHKVKKTVHVVLPNTSKHYFSSLNIKTKTDEVDARVLSRFGAERRHKAWQPPRKAILELRNITRYYVQLQEQKTALSNIKHSKESAYSIQAFITNSNKKLVAQIDRQIAKCQEKVKELIEADPQLSAKVKKLLTVKGVGLITLATVIAETLGFEHVRSARQLTSYAGYDVVQRESGTSIKGKTRISKKGNRYIRNALYFPAMVACRYNPDLKKAYLRIIQNKPSKMVGQVAIQRKLLVLIYTLWKNDTEFIENYKQKVARHQGQATQDSAVTAIP